MPHGWHVSTQRRRIDERQSNGVSMTSIAKTTCFVIACAVASAVAFAAPDALPLVERTIASGRAQLRVALPVLSAAPRQQLMPAEQALDDALNAVQRVDARAF